MESKHPANYPVKHTAVRVLALLNILCNILLACIVIYLLRDRKNEELAQYFDASTTIRSLAIGLVGILAEILINGFGFYAANQEHLGMIKGYLALMGGVAFAWWIRYLTHCTVFAFIAGTWNILHFILICLYYKDLSVVYN